jgi:hypothetical protein
MPIVSQPASVNLQAARRASALRYAQLGCDLLATIGLDQPTRLRNTLSGRAGRRRDGSISLACPWPTTTRRRLYIAAHEVAHIVLHYRVDGTRIRQLRHVEEYEAEQWAHRWLREHGVAVPRKETDRAKLYVRAKITRAIKNGAKTIDPAAAKYAGMPARLFPAKSAVEE